MGSISLQVINEKDYDMVLAVLKAFADNKIIRMETDENCLGLPGPPLTDEQWVEYIKTAEAEPDISMEEMKVIFKYLKAPKPIASGY
jgi:hypothetical protein